MSKAFLYNDKELSPRIVCRNLGLLMFTSFILRLVVAETFGNGLNRGYQGDEGSYVNLAINIAQGAGFVDQTGNPTSYRAPGLPLLVAMVISLTGPNVTAIRIFMCFFESLLILACYLLGRSASGSQKIGWVAGIIAVFFPTWVIPSGFVHSDIPAAILVALMAWTLIEGYRHQAVEWVVISGIFWGIATLTRPVGLLYAPGIILWLLLSMPDRNKRLATITAVVVSMACILAPWSVRNTYVQGTFVLTSTQGGTEFYKSNNPDATGILAIDHTHFDQTLTQRYPKEQYPNEAVRSEMFRADAIKFIIENPRRFAELCIIRFIQFWKLYSPRVPLVNSLVVIASFGVALPFFLIQVFRRGWRRGPEMLLLLIILCHTAAHVVFTSTVRYRIPIEPLVIILAIQGLCWFFESLETAGSTWKNRIPTAFHFKFS